MLIYRDDHGDEQGPQVLREMLDATLPTQFSVAFTGGLCWEEQADAVHFSPSTSGSR